MKPLFLVLLCVPFLALAQTPPDDLSGSSLKSWLKENFYNGKHQELSYRDARRRMYNIIDNVDGKVEGVYGGFLKDVTPGGNESNPMPINCEHTVPQSYFNRQLPMRSDIHHLFPTFERFNSLRGNYPFEEIPDPETVRWLIDRSDRSDIPSENIDAYSESVNGRFEPRESQKGNTARAVFYFYTMYPSFDLDRVGDVNIFYAWHLADPVDDAERRRNDLIEEHQGNRNPYIDHPQLVLRAHSIDEDRVRRILEKMGSDPGMIGGGGTTNTEPDPSKEAAINALKAVEAKLESALEEVRDQIERLQDQ